MKILNKVSLLAVPIVLTFGMSMPVFAATSPSLGSADSYSVLGGSIVTNTGATTTTRDVGVSPSVGVPPHITGFPPGISGGSLHDADGSAASAQADDTAVFGFIDQGCNTTYAGTQDLTLVSPLVAGVYCADVAFTLSGNLTLSGTGVWIFKSASTIITSSGSSVTGGDPCNVWWRAVSSVTLGTTTSFIGNVLALTSITMDTGATLNGRVLAQTGAVTLDSNVITTAACSLPSTGGIITNNTQSIPWNLVISLFAVISTASILLGLIKRNQKA